MRSLFSAIALCLCCPIIAYHETTSRSSGILFPRTLHLLKLRGGSSADNDDFAEETGSFRFSSARFGLRVDARKLSKDEFRKYFDGKWPVVLTNAFDVDNEWWTNELTTKLHTHLIEYDVRHSAEGFIETYEATFGEFISSLADNSDHEENMYLLNEDLLRNETALTDFLRLPEGLFGKDLFQYFPRTIRPYQALIIGGVGARSL
jgi:hypothetical protein